MLQRGEYSSKGNRNNAQTHTQNDFVKTWFSFCSHSFSLARCIWFNGTFATTSYWISYLRKLHFTHSLRLFAHFTRSLYLTILLRQCCSRLQSVGWLDGCWDFVVFSIGRILSSFTFHSNSCIFSRCDIFSIASSTNKRFNSILDSHIFFSFFLIFFFAKIYRFLVCIVRWVRLKIHLKTIFSVFVPFSYFFLLLFPSKK